MDDLSAPKIVSELAGTRFRHVEVHPSVASTQTLLVAEGGRDGRVVVADHQTAGRGRAGRAWTDLPGRMLMLSALLRGAGDAGLLPLAAGVAVARVVDGLGAGSSLKWPNDVQVGKRKVCGILGELASTGEYAVIGIGLNVSHARGELPGDLPATSLLIELDEVFRRDELSARILRELDGLAGGSGWLNEYRDRCRTIGSRVRVELGAETFEGAATGIREDGALLVDGRPVVAGDVVHLREGE